MDDHIIFLCFHVLYLEYLVLEFLLINWMFWIKLWNMRSGAVKSEMLVEITQYWYNRQNVQ